MKVTFFLASLALHAAVLTAPIAHTEKTREHRIPVTLVLQTIKPGVPTSSLAHPPRNQADKGATKQLKQAQPERVKTAGHTQPEIAAQKKKPIKQEAIPPPAEDIVDHHRETPHFDHALLNVLQRLPTTTASGSQPRTEEVEEKNEITTDGHLSDRDNGKATTPEQFLLMAKYFYAPKPEYPEQARREGWEGTVLLTILVNAEGRPEKIVLSRSSGFASLDTAARETVKQWRFQPARNGTVQVQSWVKVPIVFALAEAKN